MRKVKSQQHLTWIEISREALEGNLQFLQSLNGGSTRLICAPVKANAYGHGLEQILPILARHDVAYIAVHSLIEARAARKCGWKGGILCVGYIALSDAAEALQLRVEPTVYNLENLSAYARAAKKIGRRAYIHLKIETGTNRQGLALRDLPQFLAAFQKSPSLKLRGLSTHFANIEDTTDHTFAREQLRLFERAIATCERLGVRPEVRHTASSAAHLVFPETRYDMIRPGIALYGHWPSRETLLSFRHMSNASGAAKNLTPALSWKTRIAQIKIIEKGATVGYGLTYQAPRRTTLAILPVGYSDGYDRKLSGVAYVLVAGKRAPVRGRVSMNNIIVDITGIRGVKLEDEAVLLGTSGEEVISAEQMALWAGTIQYEFLSRISPAIPRIVV